MGGVAFLFAGQGAQHPAMGVDLIETSPAAAEVFAIADEVRPGTSEQCRSASKEELSQTENTQPCVFVHDLAVAVALRERGVLFGLCTGRDAHATEAMYELWGIEGLVDVLVGCGGAEVIDRAHDINELSYPCLLYTSDAADEL